MTKSFTFLQVNTLLITEDIEGFIASGAPLDEYENEATQIISAIDLLESNQQKADTIAAIIVLIWAENFNLTEPEIELRLPAIRKVAKALLTN